MTDITTSVDMEIQDTIVCLAHIATVVISIWAIGIILTDVSILRSSGMAMGSELVGPEMNGFIMNAINTITIEIIEGTDTILTIMSYAGSPVTEMIDTDFPRGSLTDRFFINTT